MSEHHVTIYISDGNPQCGKLIKQLDEWNVSYATKNVSHNRDYMKELQDIEIFGTPVTFVGEDQPAILGFQKNKIKYALGFGNNSYYSPFYEGYGE
ncbi:glutaredoxin family protein [Virgibacillus sp. NKC19-16]|uniref:glutaredoxin family protein n=1 Tax=Virgibacillus salidurans TaxID=2831673 RepID=UPI001F4453D5|nr:glutaredoxin family protein [Virgibacillus sp. NKC19-16]UJL47034.1 glutaredoxin family protein [Virgibacillus sp. NKC19-16]